MSFLDAIGAAFGKDPELPKGVEETPDGQHVVLVEPRRGTQAAGAGEVTRIHLNFDPIAPAERAKKQARSRSR